jgi:hypothetical protein
MKWGNIALALGVAIYAHGCGAALLFRAGEPHLGGFASAMIVPLFAVMVWAISEANDSFKAMEREKWRKLEAYLRSVIEARDEQYVALKRQLKDKVEP